MQKIQIYVPVLVEGRYDKAKVARIVEAAIFCTDGFGIFSQPEKRALFRRIGAGGIIVLCDSDGAGSVIRGHLRSILPADRVYDLYTPQIRGKEKRKKQASKAGFLGVEGVDDAVLADLFRKFLEKHPECGTILPCDSDPAADSVDSAKPADPAEKPAPITKADLYFWQLTGQDNAADRRNAFCKRAGLPMDMTPNAFLAAINILYTKEEAEALLRTL